jgi:hypothetical protein
VGSAFAKAMADRQSQSQSVAPSQSSFWGHLCVKRWKSGEASDRVKPGQSGSNQFDEVPSTDIQAFAFGEVWRDKPEKLQVSNISKIEEEHEEEKDSGSVKPGQTNRTKFKEPTSKLQGNIKLQQPMKFQEPRTTTRTRTRTKFLAGFHAFVGWRGGLTFCA